MTEKIVSPLIDETSQTGGTGQRRSRSVGKSERCVGRETLVSGDVWHHNELDCPLLTGDVSVSFP